MAKSNTETGCRPNRPHLPAVIIRKVVSTAGTSLTELKPPLDDVVDLDEASKVFHSHERNDQQNEAPLEFTWAGCRITVRATETVEVVPLRDDVADGSAVGESLES